MFTTLRKFFFEAPETLNGILTRVAILMIVAMLLITLVRVVDGPNHRLGVIKFYSTGMKYE